MIRNALAPVSFSLLIALSITSCSTTHTSSDASTALDETEPNDSRETANAVSIGNTVNGTIGTPGDVDFFSFHAERGDTVDLNIDAEVIGSQLDAVLVLLTSSGDTVDTANDDNRTDDARMQMPIDSTDTYVVAVTDYRSSYEGTPTGSPSHRYSLAIDAFQSPQTRSPEVYFISVEPGVEVDVFDWGGEGPPMVFLAGWGATPHFFDYFAPRFTDRFRVYVVGSRGAGSRPRPQHGYTLDTLIHDILVVIDSLDLDRITLVGQSHSSSFLSHFAARNPSRVHALIYLSGSGDWEYLQRHQKLQLFRPRLSAYWAHLESSDSFDCPVPNLEHTPDVVENEDWFMEPFGAVPENRAELTQLNAAWWRDEPAPPYNEIQAPALALWQRRPTPFEWYERRCGLLPTDSAFRDWLEEARKLHQSVDWWRVHDIELFRAEMRNATLIERPYVAYESFKSHPSRVEQEIRTFLLSEPLQARLDSARSR